MPRATIVGVGCSKCQKLEQIVREVLVDLGRDDVLVDRANPLEQDPPTDQLILPPALILDGEVIVSGRVPDRRYLERELSARLGATDSTP